MYCTGNKRKAVNKYKDPSISNKLYGVVGPIVGVSGLLLGMADSDMDAVAILAETYGHPMYLGVKGAKEILRFFNRNFKLKIKVEKLDKEIKAIEEEIVKKSEELSKVSQQALTDKLKKKLSPDVNYIG
jgi:proteasome assembly chaperone (PAC2) family protein